jgi:hypothetical protein
MGQCSPAEYPFCDAVYADEFTPLTCLGKGGSPERLALSLVLGCIVKLCGRFLGSRLGDTRKCRAGVSPKQA